MSRRPERRRHFGNAARIGVAVSRCEIRLVGVNHAGLLVWHRSYSRVREGSSLAELVGKALDERPSTLRGRVRLACVVGPAEAQLRPLHGLPQLRSSAEQFAVVAASVDRFFVNEDAGARMRVSAPVRGRTGELWAAAVHDDVVMQLAEACRAHRVPLMGVAPVAAALGHLVASRSTNPTDHVAHVERVEDGTRLHVHYDDARFPVRIWRERATAGLPTLEGDVHLPERVEPCLADAFAATLMRARDPFVIGEHSDAVHRARIVRRRTQSWIALAVAGIVAAALIPGSLAARHADDARAKLVSLATGQRQLRRVEADLAASTATLDAVASFEASRRSATLLIAELAMALPDSTAVTTIHADSLSGTLTVLAPHAAGALEAVSALPHVARAQMTGAVMREVSAGTQLERASLRFAFEGRRSTNVRGGSK